MSRHLGPLRDAAVLVVRRDGLWMHYRINPDLPDWARGVIAETERGVADDLPYREDRAALADDGSGACSPRCA
jgi:ArsR family transcriptional regulator